MKSFLSIAATLVLAGALAGCGGGSETARVDAAPHEAGAARDVAEDLPKDVVTAPDSALDSSITDAGECLAGLRHCGAVR